MKTNTTNTIKDQWEAGKNLNSLMYGNIRRLNRELSTESIKQAHRTHKQGVAY